MTCYLNHKIPGKVGEAGSEDSFTLFSLDASSATKDVVTFKRGMLNIRDTKLNVEIETPTAANSTTP